MPPIAPSKITKPNATKKKHPRSHHTASAHARNVAARRLHHLLDQPDRAGLSAYAANELTRYFSKNVPDKAKCDLEALRFNEEGVEEMLIKLSAEEGEDMEASLGARGWLAAGGKRKKGVEVRKRRLRGKKGKEGEEGGQMEGVEGGKGEKERGGEGKEGEKMEVDREGERYVLAEAVEVFQEMEEDDEGGVVLAHDY